MTHAEKILALRSMAKSPRGLAGLEQVRAMGISPRHFATRLAEEMAVDGDQNPRVLEMIRSLEAGELDCVLAGFLGYA